MTWKQFVIEHGALVHAHVLSAIVGQPPRAINALRARGVARRIPASGAKKFAALYSLYHGRAPTDDDWPKPRKTRAGRYEWLEPELRLLVSLVGRIGPQEIATVLSERLRKVTGDRSAARSLYSVRIAMAKTGMQSDDLVGGRSVSQAARDLGTPRVNLSNAIREGRLKTIRVGRFLMIPHAEIARWGSLRTAPPEGYVRLTSIRDALGISSDAKLPEFASAGYIPTAIRCHMAGGASTQFGTWYVDAEVARQLVADRHAGRPMPWHGKANRDNLKVTYALWQKRQHPDHCEKCRSIWGPTGAPQSFEDYIERYPPLAHGAKRHLTMPFSLGLTLAEVASHCAVSISIVRRAIKVGVLSSILRGRSRFVAKTDATRWKARGCPEGGEKSWVSIETAVSRYGLTQEDLTARIAAGTITSKLGTFGAMRGVTYVLRQQCVEIREREGFPIDDAARRACLSVDELRDLLQGLQFAGGDRVPLTVLQAAIRRQRSQQGWTIPEAARHLGTGVAWVNDRIRDGTVRVKTTTWGRERRYLTEPMMDRLIRAYREPTSTRSALSDAWLTTSAATALAGVSPQTLYRWVEDGDVRCCQTDRGGRYLRSTVKARAKRYWATCRYKRRERPEWLSDNGSAPLVADSPMEEGVTVSAESVDRGDRLSHDSLAHSS